MAAGAEAKLPEQHPPECYCPLGLSLSLNPRSTIAADGKLFFGRPYPCLLSGPMFGNLQVLSIFQDEAYR